MNQRHQTSHHFQSHHVSFLLSLDAYSDRTGSTWFDWTDKRSCKIIVFVSASESKSHKQTFGERRVGRWSEIRQTANKPILIECESNRLCCGYLLETTENDLKILPNHFCGRKQCKQTNEPIRNGADCEQYRSPFANGNAIIFCRHMDNMIITASNHSVLVGAVDERSILRNFSWRNGWDEWKMRGHCNWPLLLFAGQLQWTINWRGICVCAWERNVCRENALIPSGAYILIIITFGIWLLGDAIV